jgi:ligand-binding sensor domain-containing protein
VRPRARGRATVSLAVLLGLGLARDGRALDPDPSRLPYVRELWGAERGFPGGSVQAISQTEDGYLWVGTDRGLFRFDGLAFRAFPASPTAGPSIPRVQGLAADARGNLWIRPGGARLLRYHGGILDARPHLLRGEEGRPETVSGFEPSEDALTAMTLGRDGSVLVVGIVNGVLRWSGTRFEPVTLSNERYPSSPVLSIGDAPDGSLWLGTQEHGLLRLAEGRLSHFTAGLPDQQVGVVLPVGPREVWIGTGKGVVRWDGAAVGTRGLDPRVREAVATAMLADAESNVWIGTARGLMRVSADGVSALEPVEGAPAAVTALFADRDGSIWIGGPGRLERLRRVPFMALGPAQGFPSEHNGSIVVDAEGRVCVAPLVEGVFCMANGRVAELRPPGLPGDVAYSLAVQGGDLWVGRKSGALTRIPMQGPGARTYRAAAGPAAPIFAVQAGADGTVWAGTLGGGLRRLQGGGFTTYTTKDGLPSDTVSTLALRADGSLWAGTPAGLGAFSAGRWRAYTTSDGLPSDEVDCLLEDSARTLWIGTADGLALLEGGRVQVPPGLAPVLRSQVLGLAEDRLGWLWVATSRGIVRARRAALRAGTLGDGDLITYGAAEGLSAAVVAKRHRSVVADVAGRIWFSTDRGLFVVDPAVAADTVMPVVSRIESVAADGASIETSEPTRVPPGPHRVTFTFSGVSLAAPESIRYRFRLDGFDTAWSEPVTTREAAYTNLGPGAYRFRVMASDREGVWRGSEASVGLVIQPTLSQKAWFRAAAAAALLLAVVLLYRVRLRRLTREMTVRFQERLDERTRIAQELHDTLLQGFLSASMQLHVAVEQVPEPSPARRPLDAVLALMARVIDEGRNAVRGLRATEEGFELDQAFARVGEDLRLADGVFEVRREGQPRPLHPLIRDDVYRIGREALVNASRHSGAQRIEVVVDCAPHQLRVLVRDDGCGIDPEVVRHGRDGHWGLSGMRERSQRVGGHLRVSSRRGAGTEVELSVPGHVAFRSAAPRGLRTRLAALARRRWS